MTGTSAESDALIRSVPHSSAHASYGAHAFPAVGNSRRIVIVGTGRIA